MGGGGGGGGRKGNICPRGEEEKDVYDTVIKKLTSLWGRVKKIKSLSTIEENNYK